MSPKVFRLLCLACGNLAKQGETMSNAREMHAVCKQQQPKRQLKDIPLEPILYFLADHQTEWCNWFGDDFSNSVSHAFPAWAKGTKLVLRKMQSLQRRGLVSGCSCGCRGDYVITDEGLVIIGGKAHPDRACMY